MDSIRYTRSQEFQNQFSRCSDDDKNAIRRFLVEADKNGQHHMSGAKFEGTCQQLNNVLPVLMTLCPSMRPSSVGVIPGDMVQTIQITYSPGDLIIPDFILDEEVLSPMSEVQDDDYSFPLQRASSYDPRFAVSDDCPSSSAW